MTIIMICCQIDDTHSHHPPLADSIKSIASDWCRVMDATWLVIVDKTVRQVRDEFSSHLGVGDKLLVVDIGGTAAVWSGFDDKVRAWLAARLS